MTDIVICTTPRSGSNYLCEVMWQTSVLGRPREFFNPRIATRLSAESGGSVDPLQVGWYIEKMRTMHSSPNKVFAAKILFEDFEALWPFRAFRDFFLGARKVFLRRRNVIDQAISYHFAKYTGQWMKENLPRMAREQVPLALGELKLQIDWLHHQNAEWDNVFQLGEFAFEEVVYEELLAEPVKVVAAVAEKLGLGPLPAGFQPRPTIAVQRDEYSAAFFKRFQEGYRLGPNAPLQS